MHRSMVLAAVATGFAGAGMLGWNKPVLATETLRPATEAAISVPFIVISFSSSRDPLPESICWTSVASDETWLPRVRHGKLQMRH